MTCYHPVKAYRTPDGVVFSALSRHDIRGEIELPCGQCKGCRLRRSLEWAMRCMHESQLWTQNCFVTLTYGRDKLPPHGSLCYRDYQLFMKRLRDFCIRDTAFKQWHTSRASREGYRLSFQPRFFMCGEYGPLNLRPHYHACLFNCDFPDKVPAGKSGAGEVYFNSPILERLWSHGFVSVQPLTYATAAYCARYIMDKVTGDEAENHYRVVDADGVVHQRTPEFARMSLRPGIGAEWFERFGRDVFPHDFVVMDGKRYSPPRYYAGLEKRRDAQGFEEIEFARVVRAKRSVGDSTPERLAVREKVQLARLRSLRREL